MQSMLIFQKTVDFVLEGKRSDESLSDAARRLLREGDDTKVRTGDIEWFISDTDDMQSTETTSRLVEDASELASERRKVKLAFVSPSSFHLYSLDDDDTLRRLLKRDLCRDVESHATKAMLVFSGV